MVSNPPYLDPAGDVGREVTDWEPAAALWGGRDGLATIATLLRSLAGLRPGTPVLLEIGAGQLPGLAALAARDGWTLAGSRADLAGIPRVAELRR